MQLYDVKLGIKGEHISERWGSLNICGLVCAAPGRLSMCCASIIIIITALLLSEKKLMTVIDHFLASFDSSQFVFVARVCTI